MMFTRRFSLVVIFVLGSLSTKVHSLSLPKPPQAGIDEWKAPPNKLSSRREALIASATTAVTTAATLLNPSTSRAADLSNPLTSVDGGPPQRRALLEAIARKETDAVVADLIAKLEPLDPSKGNGAAVPELGGTWQLIYSVNAEAFSPLLNLPKPIRPTSLQLLGDDATREVGEGRVAQVLNFPIVPLSLLLSSGAVPLEKQLTTLEIFPPFRLELVWGDDSLRSSAAGRLGKGASKGGSRVQLVESGSDADFRSLNARDEEAQAAGRNMYKQRYLEMTGLAGDLRVSEVVAGDPVIVGEVFIHRRL